MSEAAIAACYAALLAPLEEEGGAGPLHAAARVLVSQEGGCGWVGPQGFPSNLGGSEGHAHGRLAPCSAPGLLVGWEGGPSSASHAGRQCLAVLHGSCAHVKRIGSPMA